MDKSLIHEIRLRMDHMDSEKLVAIYTANDRSEWSHETFEAIKQILEHRGESVPAQSQYIEPRITPEKKINILKMVKDAKEICASGIGFMVVSYFGLFFGANSGPGNSIFLILAVVCIVGSICLYIVEKKLGESLIGELNIEVQKTQWRNLKWYEYAWIGLPFLLVVIGGVLGGVCAAIAIILNHRIFRRATSIKIGYVITGIVTLASVGIWFICSVVINRL